MKNDNIDVIVEVILNKPYSDATYFIINLSSLRNIIIMSMSTNSSRAILSIPSKIFKKLTGKNAIIGQKYIIPKTQQYIQQIKIVDIKTKIQKEKRENKK